MNLSIFSINKTNQITTECFNWCKEQYFIHENNLTVEALIMPILALLFLIISGVFYNFSEKIIEKTDLSEENISKIYHFCNQFAKYLLIGFFIWYVWIK